MHLAVWSILAAVATLLAVAPTLLPAFLAIPLGVLFVFFLPGYWFEKILFPTQNERSLTRLPAFFVFSLALWALPATALHDLFAGREVQAEEVQGERSVRVAAALAEFPVAALTPAT